MIKKKLMSGVLALAMVASLIAGCGKAGGEKAVSYTHLRAHET